MNSGRVLNDRVPTSRPTNVTMALVRVRGALEPWHLSAAWRTSTGEEIQDHRLAGRKPPG